jgi:hypothetical protein
MFALSGLFTKGIIIFSNRAHARDLSINKDNFLLLRNGKTTSVVARSFNDAKEAEGNCGHNSLPQQRDGSNSVHKGPARAIAKATLARPSSLATY